VLGAQRRPLKEADLQAASDADADADADRPVGLAGGQAGRPPVTAP